MLIDMEIVLEKKRKFKIVDVVFCMSFFMVLTIMTGCGKKGDSALSAYKASMSEFYDKQRDGILYPWEINQVELIDCNNLGIRNLKGIEYFTKLKTLRIYGNPLYSIDLSTLTSLRVFVCYNTYISTLNVQNNTYLSQLARTITPTVNYTNNTYVYQYGSYKLEYERGIYLYA